jgi:hypothetical protein
MKKSSDKTHPSTRETIKTRNRNEFVVFLYLCATTSVEGKDNA